jgi:hypothetical protein
VSVTEKEAALVNVDIVATALSVADDVAVIVQTVHLVSQLELTTQLQ